jgi:hypothetical protein
MIDGASEQIECGVSIGGGDGTVLNHLSSGGLARLRQQR